MKRPIRLAALVTLLSLLLPVGVTSSEQVPAGPRVVYQSRFETLAPATPFDLIMNVGEFAPGAWNAPHTHSTPTFITILEGEWTTIRIVDGQKTEPVTYEAGDTVVKPAWDIHEAGNLGAVRTRLLVTRLQPRDAPGTIDVPIESFRPGAPRDQFVYQARSEVSNMSGPVDVYQAWLEWPPGSRAPAHFHPGVEFGLVIEGELTVTTATVATVGAGDSHVKGVGEIHATSNATAEKATVATTHVIAAGKPRVFTAE